LVSLDQLEALDYLIWTGSGESAGKQLNRSQPTVSRHASECSRAFGVRLRKTDKCWDTEGNSYLLDLERSVHQLCRLQGRRKLRIEINPWDQELLEPKGSPFTEIGYCGDGRPAQAISLLRRRIIDLYFTQFGRATKDFCSKDGAINVLPLASFQVGFMAHKEHPVHRSHCHDLDGLRTYPTVRWPKGILPSFEQHLTERGLWRAKQEPSKEDFIKHLEQSSSCSDVLTFDKLMAPGLHQDLKRLKTELGYTGEWSIAFPSEAQSSEVVQEAIAIFSSSLIRARHQFPTLTMAQGL